MDNFCLAINSVFYPPLLFMIVFPLKKQENNFGILFVHWLLSMQPTGYLICLWRRTKQKLTKGGGLCSFIEKS